MNALNQYASAIVHPGPRHRDDFLCCCIVLAVNPMLIECRQPTAAELDDKTYLIMDVGGRHQPELGNFDHHQYKGGDCALILLLKHLELYDSFKLAYPWMEFTNTLDTYGPAVVKEIYRLDGRAFAASMSPIERSMLTAFEACGQLLPNSWLGHTMAVIGRDLIEYAGKLTERIEWLRGNTMAKAITNGDVTALALVVPRTEVSSVDPALGMDMYRAEVPWGDKLALSVTPDPRGKGLALYRYDDHPNVDFTRLAGKEGVLFTHANGFYATLATADVDEALRLAAFALA